MTIHKAETATAEAAQPAQPAPPAPPQPPAIAAKAAGYAAINQSIIFTQMPLSMSCPIDFIMVITITHKH